MRNLEIFVISRISGDVESDIENVSVVSIKVTNVYNAPPNANPTASLWVDDKVMVPFFLYYLLSRIFLGA